MAVRSGKYYPTVVEENLGTKPPRHRPRLHSLNHPLGNGAAVALLLLEPQWGDRKAGTHTGVHEALNPLMRDARPVDIPTANPSLISSEISSVGSAEMDRALTALGPLVQ